MTSSSGTIDARKAFTMVELLVVMGIITVLVAILVPALLSVRKQAKLSVCLSNLRVIGAANSNYMMTNDGEFPFDGRDWPPAGFVDVWRLLKPTIGDPKFYVCPADFDPPFTYWWVENYGPSYGYPYLSNLDFPSSYYYLYSCYHKFDSLAAPTNNAGPAHQMYLTNVKFPTKKAIFTCYALRTGPLVNPSGGGYYYGAHYTDGWNLGFADGHAEWVRFNDVHPAQPPDATGAYNLDWTKGGLAGYDLR